MNYTVRPIYGQDPISGMPWSTPEAWWILDFQESIVCKCSTEYNAKIICKLLNYHT